jgi:hypothetical protein
MRFFPTLRRLARRVTAPVDPAHALGALLVAGLLLSAFVTDDALVMSLGRLLPILLAFLDRLITRHLPDDLFALSLGSLVKFAHSDLHLTIENGLRLQCFPSTHLILVAGGGPRQN